MPILVHAEGFQELVDKMVNRGVPDGVVLSVRHHAVVEHQRELDAQRSTTDGGVANSAAQSGSESMLGLRDWLAGHTSRTRSRHRGPRFGSIMSRWLIVCSLAAHAAACSQSKPADLHNMGSRHPRHRCMQWLVASHNRHTRGDRKMQTDT